MSSTEQSDLMYAAGKADAERDHDPTTCVTTFLQSDEGKAHDARIAAEAVAPYVEALSTFAWHVVELGNAPESYEPTWRCPAYNQHGPCDELRCGYDSKIENGLLTQADKPAAVTEPCPDCGVAIEEEHRSDCPVLEAGHRAKGERGMITQACIRDGSNCVTHNAVWPSTRWTCKATEQPVPNPDPARYLDLDSEDAAKRLAEALYDLPQSEFDRIRPNRASRLQLTRSILASLLEGMKR